MNLGVDPLTLQERVRATISMSESHFREFKSAWEGPPGEKRARDPKTVRRDIGETLVAFANADGGELLVGVEDDGSVTGVPHAAVVRADFLDAWRANVHPKTPLDKPVTVEIEIDGLSVLYFSVDKGTSLVHLTQDGRCLQRKDRESVPVASELIQFERQERLSREYDRGFVDGADATALDENVVSAAGEQIAPGMSVEKVLQLLGLAEFSGAGLRLRRAAILLFARDVNVWHPRCEVRVLRVSGTDLKAGREYNVVADKHVVGNVLELLQSAWDELRPYLVETRLGPDGRFQEQVRYPEDACREALTNAIAHRDYTIEGRAIEVYVFDDRLEVRSPGALLSTVTVDGLRSLVGVHQSRNTAIARTLRELGYMREMGEGFRRMFQLMRAHDLVEPDVVADSQQFSVALRHRSVFSEEDQRWISAFEGFNLARDEEKVMLLGRRGETLSVQQIMDVVDIVDTEDYRALIERLLNKGLIRGINSSRPTGKARRNAPRWSIVQPQEATLYLADLVRSVHAAAEAGIVTAASLSRVEELVRSDSPFRTRGRLKRSLIALDLIDFSGVVTGVVPASMLTGSPVAEASDSGADRASSAGPTEEELGDARAVSSNRGARLYFGNLEPRMTRRDLREFAERVGEVASVTLPPGFLRRGENRGYGFVQYKEIVSAKRAKEELNGAELSGRAVVVEWASSGRSSGASSKPEPSALRA